MLARPKPRTTSLPIANGRIDKITVSGMAIARRRPAGSSVESTGVQLSRYSLILWNESTFLAIFAAFGTASVV
jgi:hypothetical protein